MGLHILCSGVRLGLTSMAGHSAVAAESALATVHGWHCFAVMYGRQCWGGSLMGYGVGCRKNCFLPATEPEKRLTCQN
ncbi:hypothetical protein HK12_08065 [Acetobacter orientalis]|uniref:Uncharacterized protein n=1 Tax=Acetobacter orientalis TaxID=146474 RepID=A0A252A0Q0_9PROT|nr:hypothetical protein HK12_08065 [Acetobacter orientalis]